MTITEQDALALIRKALALHDAERPVPACVSMNEAAKMLGVSVRTLVRRQPPRNAVGKVPYRWVLEALK